MGSQKCENWFPSSFDVKSLVSRVVYSLIKRREGEREGERKVEMVEEKEGKESKRVKAKRARASSDSLFISWMEERYGLGFKREGGLGRGGLMRKGSLGNGQALSKKKPILSPKSQAEPQPANAHKNVHTPPDPTVFLKSHQAKPNLYYYLHQLSVSNLLSFSTVNQLESQLSLSAPVLNINWTKWRCCSTQIKPCVQMLTSNSILLSLSVCHYC